ncbi:urease subunit alpha, partial [Vibrio campbellii]|nr:urease subunit alpha [Vibrio campbellii]
GLEEKLGLNSPLVACKDVRNKTKQDMKHNDVCPELTVDPQTYEVSADGVLLTCEPATEVPLAQRYHLF